MKTICIGIYCFFTIALHAQHSVPTDTVVLFFTDEEQRIFRKLGPKHLQITNYAGNTLLLRLSSDVAGPGEKDVIIHSPEKKVFLFPEKIANIYITINPDSKKPAKRTLYRNGKYELFYNQFEKLYDIMQGE